jgi:hypothetical protein
MRYRATVLAVVFVTAVVLADSREWKEYLYADDLFAISTPFPPTVKERTAKTKFGMIVARYYNVSLGGDSGLMLTASEQHRDDHRTPPQVFTEAKQRSLAGIGATLVSEAPVSLEGNVGVQVEFESPKYRGLIRYFVVSRRFYQLMSVAPIGKEIAPETDHFFASFRLINPR